MHPVEYFPVSNLCKMERKKVNKIRKLIREKRLIQRRQLDGSEKHFNNSKNRRKKNERTYIIQFFYL